jgi:hypothetical protein
MGGLAPNNIDAMRYGMNSAEKAKQALFEERLPSKQASTKQSEEHAKLYGQQSALGQIPVNAIMQLPEGQRLGALQKFQGHGEKQDVGKISDIGKNALEFIGKGQDPRQAAAFLQQNKQYMSPSEYAYIASQIQPQVK